MAFGDNDHIERLRQVNEMWDKLKPLSEFAKETFGIDDIFQDNDGKVMQQLTCLDFLNLEGREGNDGKDENGVEWEMKSVNENKTSLISTHHHLNTKIIEKYRKVPWSFAVYHGIELMQIYTVHPDLLNQEYFIKWERDIVENDRQLNNPKINLDFIREKAELVYSNDRLLIKDPKTIYDEEFMKANIEYDFSPSATRAIEEIIDELDNMILQLSEDIEKSTFEKEIGYAINGNEFVKIAILQKSLKICLDFGEDVPKVDLQPTKGREKLSAKNNYPRYNYKYLLDNKKNPLDIPMGLIGISFERVSKEIPPLV